MVGHVSWRPRSLIFSAAMQRSCAGTIPVPSAAPGFIEACLPTPSQTVPQRPQWVCEVKFDGFRLSVVARATACACSHGAAMIGRAACRQIAEALAVLPVRWVTIDGEGVVCGPGAVTDFDLLRAAVGRKGTRAAFL
jgi:bifunctional non-homologous end joining protein LigD